MRPRVVLASLAGLLLALVVTAGGITVFELIVTGVPPSISRPADLIQGLHTESAPTPAAPRLEAVPGQDYAAYRAAAEQQLNSYRWVDRNTGTVAIPIQQAMDLVAQDGLPARGTSSGSDVGSPTSASSGRADAPYP